jgi:hypothetical protein
LKQRSDETFNAGKELEGMKRLTLHHIASSVYCFIASREHKYTKKPKQPPFPPQLEALLLNAAVDHMIILLLDAPPPLQWVVGYFVKWRFPFGNCWYKFIRMFT